MEASPNSRKLAAPHSGFPQVEFAEIPLQSMTREGIRWKGEADPVTSHPRGSSDPYLPNSVESPAEQPSFHGLEPEHSLDVEVDHA